MTTMSLQPRLTRERQPSDASFLADISSIQFPLPPTSLPASPQTQRNAFAHSLTDDDDSGSSSVEPQRPTRVSVMAARPVPRRHASLQHGGPATADAFLASSRAQLAKLLANLHSMSQALLAQDIPSYISARSANSIISESRPTRIQAQTLSYLNRILDELLLFIVVSARSLATDRIKTDGLLKVLNNNVLAKDAVLEAELELRNYLQGKKAEGGRVPLGLSATSRWDGTEAFPVASAYMAVSVARSAWSERNGSIH